MSVAAALGDPAPRRDVDYWRRRSRLIRALRIVLPAAVGVILAVLAGFMVHGVIAGGRAKPEEANAPIRLIHPRFVGRDDKGRAFALTAESAVRDPADYQRVMLDKPALVLDEEGPQPMRVQAAAGVYHESDRILHLHGGVTMNGQSTTFQTATSVFNTATGELVGDGPIDGAGSLGEIHAKSYGVYDKGERMVFKGGVHGRLQSK